MSKETEWLLKEKYNGKESPEFWVDVGRLEEGEPLAYVIGWVDFLGCRIDLSFRPLIPRPETEFWVEKTIAEIKKKHHDKALRILDLFAGSGCIGVAIAKHLPSAIVHFGEIDTTLIEQVRKNIGLNHIDAARTKILTTDVFSNITYSYDLILANPPYIDPTRFASVEKSVFLHEPHHALFAKENGLAFIKKLISEGPAHLRPHGKIFIEFGEDQKEEIEKIVATTSVRAEFEKDQYNKWRFVKIAPDLVAK